MKAKIIDGSQGRYRIFPNGLIEEKSFQGWKEKARNKNDRTINLKLNGKFQNRSVGQLVWEHFGNQSLHEKDVLFYKDFDSTNCHIKNLEIRSRCSAHRQYATKSNANKGSKNPNTVLNEEIVREIRRRHFMDNTRIRDIVDENPDLNLTHKQVYLILTQRTWFEYENYVDFLEFEYQHRPVLFWAHLIQALMTNPERTRHEVKEIKKRDPMTYVDEATVPYPKYDPKNKKEIREFVLKNAQYYDESKIGRYELTYGEDPDDLSWIDCEIEDLF